MAENYYQSKHSGEEIDQGIENYLALSDAVTTSAASAAAAAASEAAALDYKDDAEASADTAQTAQTAAAASATTALAAQTAAEAAQASVAADAATASAASANATTKAADAAQSAADAETAAENAQSIAYGQKGYYATPEALEAAWPAGSGANGYWAIVGTTDTVWIYDTDIGDWKDSGQATDLSNYYTKDQSDATFATLTALAATNTDVSNIVDGTTTVGNATNGIATYTHTASTDDDGNVTHYLTGSGANGKFKATSDGTITTAQVGTTGNYSTCTIVSGDDTELEVVAGRWYTFILDETDGTINFTSASGLKLKVVGGESEPENPTNSLIWVNTDTALGDIYIQTLEPSNPSDGDIFVKTFDLYSNAIQISNKPIVVVWIYGIWQRVDDTWVLKNYNCFYDDDWQGSDTLLLSGSYLLKGSWTDYDGTTISQTSDGITTGITGSGISKTYILTGIDMSAYNYVDVTYTRWIGYSGNYRKTTIEIGSVSKTITANETATTTFDISGLTGENAIKMTNTQTDSSQASSLYATGLTISEINFRV